MKKIKFILLFLLLISINTFSFNNSYFGMNQSIVKNGVGIGSVLAIVISWDRNKSIIYALLHGVFGWFYVIYFIIVRESETKS